MSFVAFFLHDFPLVSTLQNLRKRAWGPIGKFDIARLHGHFGSRGLQQNVVLSWDFKEILIRTWWHSRQSVFCGLHFAVVSPGLNFAEFKKTRAGGPIGKFDIARLYGHLGSRGLQQNVVLGSHFKEILVRTWWHSRQAVFYGLLFAGLSAGPNFAEFQKTRTWGPSWQIWHSSASQALWEPRFAAKCCARLRL